MIVPTIPPTLPSRSRTRDTRKFPTVSTDTRQYGAAGAVSRPSPRHHQRWLGRRQAFNPDSTTSASCTHASFPTSRFVTRRNSRRMSAVSQDIAVRSLALARLTLRKLRRTPLTRTSGPPLPSSGSLALSFSKSSLPRRVYSLVGVDIYIAGQNCEYPQNSPLTFLYPGYPRLPDPAAIVVDSWWSWHCEETFIA